MANETPVIERTPLVIIRYEATGIVFERSLSGEDITEDNLLKAVETVVDYSLPTIEFEIETEDFPVEAEEALGTISNGTYWDDLVESAAKALEETDEEDEDDDDDAPTSIKGFEVGDRVIFIGRDTDFSDEPLYGLEATVRTLDNGSCMNIGLVFDEDIEGHNLDDKRNGRYGGKGWYVDDKDIRHVNPTIGSFVKITKDDPMYDELRGKLGRVIDYQGNDVVLVNWAGWDGGHNGGQNSHSMSHWWHDPNSVKVVDKD